MKWQYFYFWQILPLPLNRFTKILNLIIGIIHSFAKVLWTESLKDHPKICRDNKLLNNEYEATSLKVRASRRRVVASVVVGSGQGCSIGEIYEILPDTP